MVQPQRISSSSLRYFFSASSACVRATCNAASAPRNFRVSNFRALVHSEGSVGHELSNELFPQGKQGGPDGNLHFGVAKFPLDVINLRVWFVTRSVPVRNRVIRVKVYGVGRWKSVDLRDAKLLSETKFGQGGVITRLHLLSSSQRCDLALQPAGNISHQTSTQIMHSHCAR
jgi:hypothetical protein